jgi:hypothetical protein
MYLVDDISDLFVCDEFSGYYVTHLSGFDKDKLFLISLTAFVIMPYPQDAY